MKLTLTQTDIETLIRDQYNLPTGTVIEIGGLTPTDKSFNLIANQLRIVTTQCIPHIRCLINEGQKINAIKAVRELTNYGLAQSKGIVENFGQFTDFLLAWGRFPVLTGDYGHYKFE